MRIKLITFAFTLAISIGCESWQHQKNSWERAKDPDLKAEWVLTRLTAGVAGEDLREIANCGKKSGFLFENKKLTGKYEVKEGFHFLTEISLVEADELAKKTLENCAAGILSRKKRNVGNGLKYQPDVKARNFEFSFAALIFPTISGEVTSEKYRHTEKIE